MKLDVIVDEILNISTHRYGVDSVSKLYVYCGDKKRFITPEERKRFGVDALKLIDEEDYSED